MGGVQTVAKFIGATGAHHLIPGDELVSTKTHVSQTGKDKSIDITYSRSSAATQSS